MCNCVGGNVELGDIISWDDKVVDDTSRIGIILDIYEDVYDTELIWLYVQWPNIASYVYSGMINVISSVSNSDET